jgi:phage-related protein
VFNNKSDDKGAYLYPKLVITMNNSGGNVTITNSSDASRVFSFTGLLTSEVITIDNSLQQITSSTGLLRMSNFNKKFFRLIPEINNLRFQGNIASIDMTYQFVAKI